MGPRIPTVLESTSDTASPERAASSFIGKQLLRLAISIAGCGRTTTNEAKNGRTNEENARRLMTNVRFDRERTRTHLFYTRVGCRPCETAITRDNSAERQILGEDRAEGHVLSRCREHDARSWKNVRPGLSAGSRNRKSPFGRAVDPENLGFCLSYRRHLPRSAENASRKTETRADADSPPTARGVRSTIDASVAHENVRRFVQHRFFPFATKANAIRMNYSWFRTAALDN